MKGAGIGGAVVLGILALLTLAVTLNGIMLSYMWQWFVVPLGVRPIGVAQAIGVALIVLMLTVQETKGKDDSDPAEFPGKILLALVGKIVAFGIAYGLSFLVPA